MAGGALPDPQRDGAKDKRSPFSLEVAKERVA